MQKLHKSKTPKVYKNKKLNNANFGTYNLNDYQVFLQLVSKLGKVDINGTYQQPQDLEREHTLTAKEFSQAFGIDLNTAYGVLKRASNKLARTAITLEKPELFQIWDIPVCQNSVYNTKEGSLTIKFNEDIMPYLAQVKQKFVLYNLKEIANFGSLYSTRLYELIQEFKDTGYIIKSVAQLRDALAVGKRFPDYNNFKRYTFAHAVEEINAQYPTMKLRFEEIKEGRKVVSIDFRFTPSTIIEQYNPVTKQIVSVTSKPKQVQPKRSKKDDDNTPPTVHPDQQELPLSQESSGQKILKNVGKTLTKFGVKAVPEVQEALDKRKDTSVKETLKAVTKGSINADKRRIADIAKLAKILMDTMGISALEAYEIAEKKVKLT